MTLVLLESRTYILFTLKDKHQGAEKGNMKYVKEKIGL